MIEIEPDDLPQVISWWPEAAEVISRHKRDYSSRYYTPVQLEARRKYAREHWQKKERHKQPPEVRAAKKKAYRAANKEKLSAKYKAWCAANQDKVLARRARYREKLRAVSLSDSKTQPI